MATNKLLKPTNVTIAIPAFTDQPDQRVNSNCIDKEADAINALNDQMENKTPKYSYEYTNDVVSIPNSSFGTVKSLNITPGIWLVIGTINFSDNTTGIRICMVTGDSTDIQNGMSNSSLASGRATLSFTRVFRASSNMTVYLRGYQNSGSAMNVNGQIVAVRLDTQYT